MQYLKNFIGLLSIFKKVKINIHTIRDNMIILNFYIVTIFFYYFGINGNIIYLF